MTRITLLIVALSVGCILAFGGSPKQVAAVSCADFQNQAEAQQYLRDHPWDSASVGSVVGIACKDLPCPCNRFPVTNTNVPSPTPTPTFTPTATSTSTPAPTATTPPQAVATATPVSSGSSSLGSPPQSPVQTVGGTQLIAPPRTGDAGLR